MYYKKKDPDLILWDRIKNGEFPYVRVMPDGRKSGRLQLYDMKNGQCTYDREIRTRDNHDYQTLKELIDDPRHAFQLLYIAPPTEDFPYWLNSITVEDPNTKEIKGMMKRYFSIYRHGLRRGEEDFILHEHKQLMDKKGIKLKEDKDYEESLIDETNYDRRYLLIRKRAK